MSTTKAQNLYYSIKKASPLGPLRLVATDGGVCLFAFGEDEITFLNSAKKHHPGGQIEQSESHPALAQIDAYLHGETHQIATQIDWRGMTPFQVEVYQAVMAIPYGETRTYGQIADQIGRPRAARAVGTANGANLLPLIIPCHRLVGADGSLRGYGGVGGLKTKQWLLDLEKTHVGKLNL